MMKILDEYDPTGKGTYLLEISAPVPEQKIKSYRIGGITYKPVPLHGFKKNVIGVYGAGGFVGKEVEFVTDGSYDEAQEQERTPEKQIA